MATELTGKQHRVVEQMQPLMKSAPWILRVTERKKYTGPVLEICERLWSDKPKDQITKKQESRLKEYGRIYNGSMRIALPAIRNMMMQMVDEQGRPLIVHLLLDGNKIEYRGQIPLDETIGAKLALLFRLHPQIQNLDRVELMAWRIERFSREETAYWLTKVSISAYGKRSIEWAKAGLRLMLAGRNNDPGVKEMLEQLRK